RTNQYKEAMTDIREQQGEPQRFDGAFRAEINGKVYYLNLNPQKYIPSTASMVYNDYGDPENANGAWAFGMENAQTTGINFYAHWDALQKGLSGKSQDIYAPSYLPQGKIAAWAVPAVFGNVDVPQGFGWAARPEYYEYNVARELTNMV